MIASPQPVILPPTTDPPNMIDEVAVEVTEALGEGSGREMEGGAICQPDGLLRALLRGGVPLVQHEEAGLQVSHAVAGTLRHALWPGRLAQGVSGEGGVRGRKERKRLMRH